MPTRTEDMSVIRARFDQGVAARNSQLTREISDIKFFNGDQWPADVVAARSGQQAMGGLPAVPARPCLSVNRLIGPVRQVLNEFRSAAFSIQVTAADDFGDLSEPVSDTELDIREGLIRRIQRNSAANIARYWAFERGVLAGLGWYRIVVKQLPRSDDQEIALARIYNQNAVIPDPSHVEPDGSDMRWCFINHDLSMDTYEATYGENPKSRKILQASTTDEQWRSLGDDSPNWFSFTDDGTKSIRVAEYYYFEKETVKHCILNGLDILEETEIPYTPWIPVLKYIGEEQQPHDGQWRAQGMVRPSRDGQQASNFMLSSVIERTGLSAIAPLMVAEGQDEGYEREFDLSNTHALSRVHYKTRDLEGNQVGPPIRNPAGEAQIQAMVQGLVLFNEAIQTTALVPDAAQGRVNPSLRSGATVQALVEQSDQGTSNYTQNMVDITMFHEARILNSMLPIYANRPGRLVSVITGTDERKQVTIGDPVVMQGGQTVPAPDPTMGNAKLLDFTENAQCNIAIKIVKNFDTRRQEESAMLGAIIQHNPEMFAIYGPLWAKNLDVPGHQEIAKLAMAVADPRVQQVMQGQTPIPPQVQKQMQEMQQMGQAMQQKIAELEQEQQAKAVEKQADIQQTQMDNATKLEIAKLNSSTQIAIADMKSTRDAMVAQAEMQQEQFRSVLDAIHELGLSKRSEAHERDTQVLDHMNERTTQARDHQHEAALTAQTQAHEQTQTAKQQDHERTMQKEAPKPKAGGA
jgi:hypothetical protein